MLRANLESDEKKSAVDMKNYSLVKLTLDPYQCALGLMAKNVSAAILKY